jgi:ABC-type iron transport system FetAB permease component
MLLINISMGAEKKQAIPQFYRRALNEATLPPYLFLNVVSGDIVS